MFILYLLGCFLFLCLQEQKGIAKKETILSNFCLSLSWPLFALGLIWIRRSWIRNNIVIFFDLDELSVDLPVSQSNDLF